MKLQRAFALSILILPLQLLSTIGLHAQLRSDSLGTGREAFQTSSYVARGLPSLPTVKHDHFRAIGGVGGNAGLSDIAPVAFGGTVSYQHDWEIFSAGVIGSNSNNRQPPRHTWTEVDLLVGVAIDGYDLDAYGFNPDRIFASLSAGLSFNSLSTRWRNGRRFVPIDSAMGLLPPNSLDQKIGFPIELQAMYAPLSFLGIGVTLFANVNPIHPSYGGLLSLEVGVF